MIGVGDGVTTGVRVDLIFRIDPGPGNYSTKGNRASALIQGKRVPVVGTVTMDMTMLDVTDVACEVGDVATLLGRDGDECITVDELGTLANTVSYEILVGLKLRAERVYLGGET